MLFSATILSSAFLGGFAPRTGKSNILTDESGMTAGFCCLMAKIPTDGGLTIINPTIARKC